MASKKKFYISPSVEVSTDEYTNTLVGSVEGGGGKLGNVKGSIEKTIVKDNPDFNIPKKMNIEYQRGNEDSNLFLRGQKQGKSKTLSIGFTKRFKKGGLKEWFNQKWVDIGSKRKDGSFAPCGRSKLQADRKRKYPKCVPAAKAARMTDSQRRSAVARKRAKPQGVGGKPTNVKTFTKKYYGGMIDV